MVWYECTSLTFFAELGHINAVEKELNRVQGMLNERAQKGTVKVQLLPVQR
jgi:hypothetical protein